MFELDGCKTTIWKYNCGGEEGGHFRNVDYFPSFLSICVRIYIYMHMLLSQVYLDLLSGQTVLKLHLAAPFKAIQNREYKSLLPFEIQVGIPIFLSPLFNFFHCHMCTYELFSPLLTGPVVCTWIVTLEVTARQSHGIFSLWSRCFGSS